MIIRPTQRFQREALITSPREKKIQTALDIQKLFWKKADELTSNPHAPLDEIKGLSAQFTTIVYCKYLSKIKDFDLEVSVEQRWQDAKNSFYSSESNSAIKASALIAAAEELKKLA